MEAIDGQANGEHPAEFKDQNLQLVNPFWRDLPHCDIFSCITPDLLHQLHGGLFSDHIISWTKEAMPGGKEEMDERFQAMSLHPSLRHFTKGISLTSQWTGTEHKNMEKVFLGVIAGATDPRVVLAVRGVLDFIYYTYFKVHTDESLAQLDTVWLMFHENKDIWETLEIRKHFNINKLHNIKHYLDSICSHGTVDGFNTEASECLQQSGKNGIPGNEQMRHVHQANDNLALTPRGYSPIRLVLAVGGSQIPCWSRGMGEGGSTG